MADKKIESDETSAPIPLTPDHDEPNTGPGHAVGRWFDWEKIAEGHKMVRIRYKGMTYELRETRNGKLILTK
jgi:hemin uptake protein HemP